MELLNREQAVADLRKITDYLLSPTHPIGRHKAAFFSRLGFSLVDPGLLSDSLIEHARRNDVVEEEKTEFGRKFVVEGPLGGPSGRSALVRSVWVIEIGDEVPRLVTAHPIHSKPRIDS